MIDGLDRTSVRGFAAEVGVVQTQRPLPII